MAHLFDPITFRSLTLRNRIGVSPMCQYSSVDGVASDWHLVHLGARAVGGAALVMAEATAVEPRGRITPGDAGLWNDAQIEPLARINHFIKAQGAVAGIQLAHAGRKASAARPWEGGHILEESAGGWEPLAPSALAFGAKLTRTPHELSPKEIGEVRGHFVAATCRALEAGYDWIELHAAHGYLAHSFLSPISNKRSDTYGGSFENRCRFVVETSQAMRAVIPENLPFSVRLSCSDWMEGGWTIEDSIALCKLLKRSGVDLIDCSSGGTSTEQKIYPAGPGWQIPFADRIRREAEIATAGVGIITSPAQADQIVRTGQADLVFLAREMLRDPYWPFHAAAALKKEIKLLPQPYNYVV